MKTGAQTHCELALQPEPLTVGRLPHVADITAFWSPSGGGVRRYLLTKRCWLQRRGARHTLLVPTRADRTDQKNGNDAQRLARSGDDQGATKHGERFALHPVLSGIPIPFSHGYRWPWNRRAAIRALVDAAPDVIEAGDPFMPAAAALDAAKILRVPAVAFCHGDLPALAGRLINAAAERALGQRLRAVYAPFDRVLVASAHMQRRLQHFGVRRVRLQPLGVDTEVFRPDVAAVDWASQLGLPADTRIVVFAGRMAPEKHLDDVAEAVRRLGPRYALVTIGAGPAPPRGAQVHRQRFINDSAALAGALAGADVFVHAGDCETFGLAVLEAMACGVPVVARAKAGLAELVDDTVGQAVHPDGPIVHALAEAIGAVCERSVRQQRGATGKAARQRAEAHGWDSVFDGLLGHYARLQRPQETFHAASDRAPQPIPVHRISLP